MYAEWWNKCVISFLIVLVHFLSSMEKQVKNDSTELYYMALAWGCSCYNEHSDWLILRPVTPAGRLMVYKNKAAKINEPTTKKQAHTFRQTKYKRCKFLTNTLAGCFKFFGIPYLNPSSNCITTWPRQIGIVIVITAPWRHQHNRRSIKWLCEVYCLQC